METIELNGLTPGQLFDEVGTHVFNFMDLLGEFREVCRDYSYKYEEDETYQALEFASKTLFEIGPTCRNLQKGTYKEWRLKFHYDIETEKVETEVHVSNDPSYYTPITNNVLKLTLVQAELLAIQTFTYFGSWWISHMLVTPLAHITFPGDDLPILAGLLKRTPAAVANIINSSCYEGGEHLAESEAHVALVSVLAGTKALKAEDYDTIKKLRSLYLSKNKGIDAKELIIYAKYSTNFAKEFGENEARGEDYPQLQRLLLDWKV